MVKAKRGELPPIPDKVYFTIGEVSALCAVKAHVIRYWETEFRMLSPVRRRNRRYYQRKDIELIRQISTLLYQEGYTIEGARQRLQRKVNQATTAEESAGSNIRPGVQTLLADLRQILIELES
jgi:DNA-binding transcriptional MerR regulator